PAAEKARSMLVATERAVMVDGYRMTDEFVGKVEAHRESQLSLESGGLLLQVTVDEGDEVQAGEVLARLDTQLLESQRNSVAAQLEAETSTLDEMIAGPRSEIIEAARAEVEQWTIETRLAQITHKRHAKLIESNAASHQEFDDSLFKQESLASRLRAAKARLLELENGTRKERIQSQRAQVDRLRSDLRTIEIRLNKSVLRAPYSGTISNRFVDEGAVIEAGMPVLTLLETTRPEIRIGVTHDVLKQLAIGSEHTVKINGSSYLATVRSSRPDRDQTTRTISVLLDLGQAYDAVHVGDLALLQIERGTAQSGFWVPLASLTESYRGLWAAYAAVPNGTREGHLIETREIEVLHQTADRAFVKGTLQNGELIVTGGLQRLVPGQQISIETFPSSMQLAVNR
ncbi:MAG: efflux RND transporter periplasmic adaptor subunit, partial [Planctomycetota bacterium]